MNIVDVVHNIINQFVLEGKKFSDYEVTQKVREIWKGTPVWHCNVSSEVAAHISFLVEQGKYRLLTNSIKTPGIRYYGPVTRVTNVNDELQKVAKLPLKNVMWAEWFNKHNLKGKSGREGDKVRILKRDKRGRICIPADFLRGIDAYMEEVDVCERKDQKCYYIEPSDPFRASNSLVLVQWYAIDKDGNVRISKKYVDRLIGDGLKVKCMLSTKKRCIKLIPFLQSYTGAE